MVFPFGEFEFSTTINAIPEKAKGTDVSFDIVPDIACRVAGGNKKAGTAVPALRHA
jgi:hypothetical protein